MAPPQIADRTLAEKRGSNLENREPFTLNCMPSSTKKAPKKNGPRRADSDISVLKDVFALLGCHSETLHHRRTQHARAPVPQAARPAPVSATWSICVNPPRPSWTMMSCSTLLKSPLSIEPTIASPMAPFNLGSKARNAERLTTMGMTQSAFLVSTPINGANGLTSGISPLPWWYVHEMKFHCSSAGTIRIPPRSGTPTGGRRTGV